MPRTHGHERWNAIADVERELRRRVEDADALIALASKAALAAAAVEATQSAMTLRHWSDALLTLITRAGESPALPAWAERVLARNPTVRATLPDSGELELQRVRSAIETHRKELEAALVQLQGLTPPPRSAGHPVELGRRVFIEEVNRRAIAAGQPPPSAVIVALLAVITEVDSPPGVHVRSFLDRWRGLVRRVRDGD